jgi:alkanesulfonate monooxygenase SsuD/methylene tetrahydromethanopterin reductase-like flavin-dependent oxidoreductase (luciferase family)
VRTGVVLPTFRSSADETLSVARQAEVAGVDGVFCYDHLWPLGQPERPAIAPFPLLGAVAAVTDRVCLGPLVARVGLVPDEVLLSEFDALALLAPGRVIAAVGTGDRRSAPENEAFGVPFAPAAGRRDALAHCVRSLRERGLPVWVGGGARRTMAIAEAEGVAVNLWAASPDAVALQAELSEVTWGGPAPEPGTTPASGESALERQVRELAEAGASWAVFGWPVPLDVLVASAAASDRQHRPQALPPRAAGHGGADG